MVSGSSTSAPSFIRRMTGWLPLPSLPACPRPSIPAFCKNAFQTLKNLGGSSPEPVSTRAAADLTDIVTPGAAAGSRGRPSPSAAVRSAATSPQSQVRRPEAGSAAAPKTAASNKRKVIIAVAGTVCMAVIYGAMRYFQSPTTKSAAQAEADAQLATDVAGTAVTLGTALTKAAAKVDLRAAATFAKTVVGAVAAPLAARFGEALMSVVPLSLAAASCDLSATAELPLGVSFDPWRFFSPSAGRYTVTTNSTLPPNVEFVESQFNTIPSNIQAPSTSIVAASGKGIYFGYTPAGASSDSIGVFNADPNAPFKNVDIPTGITVSQMKTANNQLCVGGSDSSATYAKCWGVTDSLNPVYQGQVTVAPSVTGSVLATTGQNQWGCLTNNATIGFVYFDTTTFQPNGSIPGITGSVMAASPSFYCAATPTGIVSMSAAPSSSTIGTPLAITGVVSLSYALGYFWAGTVSNLYQISCSPTGVLAKVNTLPPQNIISSIFTSSALAPNVAMYSTYSAPGISFMSAENVTAPVFPVSSSNLVPNVGSTGTFVDLGNGMIGVLTGGGFYFLPPGDTWSFQTPTNKAIGGASAPSYAVNVQANTATGALGGTKTCTISVAPALTPGTPIPGQVAATNRAFSGTIPSGAVQRTPGTPNNPITSILSCLGGHARRITLNPQTDQLSGIPLPGDQGIDTCTVQFTDTDGATATTDPFDFIVTDAPTIFPPPSQLATIGAELSFNVTADSPNPPLTYTFDNLPSSFTNGTPSNLPYTNYDGAVRGIATNQDLGTRPVDFTVTDRYGLQTTGSFNLNAVQPASATVNNPISTVNVNTGKFFSFPVPPSFASNPSCPTCPITVKCISCPEWLSFDGTLFSGTAPISANIFGGDTYQVSMQVNTHLPNGQTTTTISTFSLILGGTSVIQLLGFVGGPSAAVLAKAIANRKVPYNKWVIWHPWVMSTLNVLKSVLGVPLFCCISRKPNKFDYSEGTFYSGQSLEHTFKDTKEVAWIKIYYDDEPGPLEGELPDWVRLDGALTKVTRIIALHVPPLLGVSKVSFVGKFKHGDFYREMVSLTRGPTTHFNRTCMRAKRGEVTGIECYSAVPQDPTVRRRRPQPMEPLAHGLRYDEATHSIVGNRVPSNPMFVRVLGADNVVLETIMMNIKPSAKFTNISEEDEEGDSKMGAEESPGAAAASPNSAASGSGGGPVIVEIPQSTALVAAPQSPTVATALLDIELAQGPTAAPTPAGSATTDEKV